MEVRGMWGGIDGQDSGCLSYMMVNAKDNGSAIGGEARAHVYGCGCVFWWRWSLRVAILLCDGGDGDDGGGMKIKEAMAVLLLQKGVAGGLPSTSLAGESIVRSYVWFNLCPVKVIKVSRQKHVRGPHKWEDSIKFVEAKQENEKKATLDGLNQRFKPYLS
ncbi:unnamed protein product [Dovyalis caffra]|uniref:Uncharacterized protein n=1 Tax=Dovyalis caffra TaxID=77055 RepID=A0AAV1RQN0_9ROSI|nr:unnamed protein product [Dovyalis caffra]